MPDRNRLAELEAVHHALDVKLAELQRHISLSPAEQLETTRLKKLKLAAKDELMRLKRSS
jgi:hypothetical protein